MFEKNLEKIASYNGPLAFLLRRIQRAPRPLDFTHIPQEATLVLGSRCDISNSPKALVLEPDLERLFDALHTEQWTKWLDRPETRLLYMNPHNGGLFERAVLWAMRTGLNLAADSEAADSEAPAFFEEARACAASLASYLIDFQDYGARATRHILAHAQSWSKLHTLDQLPFQNQPVCIVGAGPSLEEDLDLLRSLQKRAWVLSGGSAIPVLQKAGIEPDFLVLVDALDSQRDRAPHYANLTCPALIAPRALPEALDYIKGARVHLSFEHPLLQRLEKQALLPSAPLDLGWSLVTAAVVATGGASHTLLLGCDLAYKNGRGYANDAFPSPNEEKISLPSKGGSEVFSRMTWRLERDFIARLASEESYNVGSFGVDIPGWKNACPDLPLLDKSYVLPSPHVAAPIELTGDIDYLVNWVWDRIKYMALTFEELMGAAEKPGPMAQIVRSEIASALNQEFMYVTTG